MIVINPEYKIPPPIESAPFPEKVLPVIVMEPDDEIPPPQLSAQLLEKSLSDMINTLSLDIAPPNKALLPEKILLEIVIIP